MGVVQGWVKGGGGGGWGGKFSDKSRNFHIIPLDSIAYIDYRNYSNNDIINNR